MSIETLLLFVPTITVLVILPGPDFALASQISLVEGKRQGEACAIGITLGICVHTIFAMWGISAILAESALLYKILKYIGAMYLLYMGVGALIRSFGKNGPVPGSGKGITPVARTFGRALGAGFLTNVLNPKAILYFMVLYPQFLDPARPIVGQFLEMGLITAAIGLAWYMLLANLLGHIRRYFTKPSFQKWLLRVTGGILVSFGARLAVSE